MKSLTKVCVLCTVLLASYQLNAQVTTSSRPYLFNNFSARIPTTVAELNKAFLGTTGSSIQLNFTGNFSFTGTVFSSVRRYNNLSSVLIKVPSLHNALLSISKRINDDQTVTYVGRIINEKYADGYELKKNVDGSYSFEKIKTEDLIQDF
jgi:hypothetical protein